MIAVIMVKANSSFKKLSIHEASCLNRKMTSHSTRTDRVENKGAERVCMLGQGVRILWIHFCFFADLFQMIVDRVPINLFPTRQTHREMVLAQKSKPSAYDIVWNENGDMTVRPSALQTVRTIAAACFAWRSIHVCNENDRDRSSYIHCPFELPPCAFNT